MVHVMLLPVLNILYFYISTQRSMCALLNMAVFLRSQILCFTVMLVRYFLDDFEMVPECPLLLVSLLFLHSTCAVSWCNIF